MPANKPLRLIVCGGRDFTDRRTVKRRLNFMRKKYGIEIIIEGGARGADRLAREWAISKGIPYKTYQAKWNKYGRSAGYVRNARMLKCGRPDGVLGFAGGKGTAMMLDLARKAGVKVWDG